MPCKPVQRPNFACAQGQAATLFAIVTERAAPAAIEAARRHLMNHLQDRIVLSTPAQWMAAGEREAGLWIMPADTVLAVSLFGDPARRLKVTLPRHATPGCRQLCWPSMAKPASA